MAVTGSFVSYIGAHYINDDTSLVRDRHAKKGLSSLQIFSLHNPVVDVFNRRKSRLLDTMTSDNLDGNKICYALASN